MTRVSVGSCASQGGRTRLSRVADARDAISGPVKGANRWFSGSGHSAPLRPIGRVQFFAYPRTRRAVPLVSVCGRDCNSRAAHARRASTCAASCETAFRESARAPRANSSELATLLNAKRRHAGRTTARAPTVVACSRSTPAPAVSARGLWSRCRSAACAKWRTASVRANVRCPRERQSTRERSGRPRTSSITAHPQRATLSTVNGESAEPITHSYPTFASEQRCGWGAMTSLRRSVRELTLLIGPTSERGRIAAGRLPSACAVRSVTAPASICHTGGT